MKQFLFKVAAAGLSVLFFLICLEIVVRLLGLSQPRLGQQHHVFGTSYIPGQTATNEFGVKIEIGGHGFRGPTPVLEKRPGFFRVILLGDSFLHARAIPYEKIFYSLLNSEFKAEGKSIELINMGVEGYGTVQEYLVYHHLAKRYRPDLVILFFYAGNDLQENYPPRDFRPGFRLAGGELEYVPFKVKAGRRGPVRDFFRKYVRIYNYIPDLLRSAASIWADRVSEEENKRRLKERRVQFKERADTYTTQYVLRINELGETWRVTLEVLKKLNREVVSDGGRLALCVIPTITQVYDRYWDLLRDQYQAAETKGWDRFKPQKILKAFADHEKIPFIPLSRKMAEAAGKDGRIFYLPGDYHFSEEGHLFLAGLIGPAILEAYQKEGMLE